MPSMIANPHSADARISLIRAWACAIHSLLNDATPMTSNTFVVAVRNTSYRDVLSYGAALNNLLRHTGAIIHSVDEGGRRTLQCNRRTLFVLTRSVLHNAVRAVTRTHRLTLDECRRDIISYTKKYGEYYGYPSIERITEAAFAAITARFDDPFYFTTLDTTRLNVRGVHCAICNSAIRYEMDLISGGCGGCVNCGDAVTCFNCHSRTFTMDAMYDLHSVGRPFLPTADYVSRGGGVLHPCCHAEEIRCGICGTTYGVRSYETDEGCPNSQPCPYCGIRTHRDDNDRCVRCGQRTITCVSCGSLIDDVQVVEGTDLSTILCYLCADAERERSVEYATLFSFSDEPRCVDFHHAPFKLRSPLTFGLEVECGLSPRLQDKLVSLGWECTYDGSVYGVGNSCELVSPVLTASDLTLLLEASRSVLLNGEVNASCGFHIHIGVRQIFSWFEIYKIMLYAKAYEGLFYATQPVCRTNNNYARSIQVPSGVRSKEEFFLAMYGTPDVVRNSRGRKYPDNGARISRYAWLNVHAYLKHGTIENRLHAGTTDTEKIYHWVLFTAAWFEHAALTHPSNWKSPLEVCPAETAKFTNERIASFGRYYELPTVDTIRSLFTGDFPNKLSSRSSDGKHRGSVKVVW